MRQLEDPVDLPHRRAAAVCAGAPGAVCLVIYPALSQPPGSGEVEIRIIRDTA